MPLKRGAERRGEREIPGQCCGIGFPDEQREEALSLVIGVFVRFPDDRRLTVIVCFVENRKGALIFPRLLRIMGAR
jgi:hypothetical protein